MRTFRLMQAALVLAILIGGLSVGCGDSSHQCRATQGTVLEATVCPGCTSVNVGITAEIPLLSADHSRVIGVQESRVACYDYAGCLTYKPGHTVSLWCHGTRCSFREDQCP